jgi:hypothetical protein
MNGSPNGSPDTRPELPAFFLLRRLAGAFLPGGARVGVQALSGRPPIGRLLLAAVLLLGVIGPLQIWVGKWRAVVVGREPAFNAELAYKAPALVLTGLRGPLVTSLWLAAEQGKNDRDWELLQTYYGAIGSLQPHFAQGYLMNGWNSAYNISYQFNSLPYKYVWINKGIELVKEGDRRNPDHVDLVQYLSDLYGDKLGRSYEKTYYQMRFREDTRGAVLPLLDEKDPAAVERYPYGVSPLGYGWYYSELAWRLVRDTGQHHHQFGDPVMSSRPALYLRDWAYQDHEVARLRARQVFGAPPYELSDEFNFRKTLTPEQRERIARRPVADVIDETRWLYASAARIFERSMREYDAHIKRFGTDDPSGPSLYRRHIQNAWFDRQVMLGNAAAFEALVIASGRGPGTMDDIARHFRAAEDHYRRAVGDLRVHRPEKRTEWWFNPEIGMAPYVEAHLPPGSGEINDEMRVEVIQDIEFYRKMVLIMYDCRVEAEKKRHLPVTAVFPPELVRRLVGWTVMREPPQPLGR